MNFIKKLKTDRKFLLIVGGLVIAVFLIPYLTIPVIILWWFYKKSRFSKKFKIVTTSSVGGLLAILITWFGIAYANDAQPYLTITQPSSLTNSIKAPKINIKGTYSPADRTVEINGQDIHAKDGSFDTIYQLKQGENKIEIQAGKVRWATVDLDITRQLTDAEKATLVTPTSKPSVIPTIETKIKVTNTPIPTALPKPKFTPKPTSKPKSTYNPPVDDSNGFPENYQQISISEISRNPSNYNGKVIMFNCDVASFARDDNGDVSAVNCSDPNDITAIVQVDISNLDNTKINIGDNVNFYGYGNGAFSGQNGFGATISEGLVLGMYINDFTSGYSNSK